MKRVLLAASLLIFGASASVFAAAQGGPVAGGYTERRTNDRGVRAAAAFAVRERGRQTRRRVTLLSITSAETQVVAGVNYRLVMDVREGGEVRSMTAVV